MDERVLRLLDGNKSHYPYALEQQFARILNRIIELWGTPQMDSYFYDLMMDTRGGTRQGFPKAVASDIFNLSNAYDAHKNRLREQREMDAWAGILEEGKKDVEIKGGPVIAADFMKHIESGNAEMVQHALASGVDLESRDERNWTPLMISSFNGNEKLALILICKGANIHTRDRNGYTALHWTAYNGFDKVVDLLIREGAEVNARSEFGWTPLMQAATRGHMVVVMRLLAGGANINMVSNDGWTALHKACANGHEQIVKFLLSKGADPKIEYADGTTALALAIKNRHEGIVELLRSYVRNQ
jgi:ankyrin repeat protein